MIKARLNQTGHKGFGLFVFCLFTLAASTTWGKEPKQVDLLLLPTQNISGNSAYQYLQSSITDAFRKELKARVAFREFPAEQIKELAKRNYIYEKDMHTQTAAINLGLLASQDIVITGTFDQQGIGQEIVGKLHVYDIAEKKQVLEFDYKLELNNQMFEQIDQMAGNAAEAMLQVLPNRETWERSGLANYQTTAYDLIQLKLGAGVYVQSPVDRDFLQKNRLITQADMPVRFLVQTEYLKFGWLHRQLVVGGLTQFGYITDSYQTEFAGETVPTTAMNFDAGLIGGYRFTLDHRFYVIPALAVGGTYTRSELHLRESELLALDTTNNQTVAGSTYTNLAVFLLPSVRFNFRFTPRINVTLDTGYRLLLFSDTTVGSLQFLLGAGYSL